ncbi:hypothetical protein Tco_0054066 [Tanacetum coccineum]
MTTFAEHIIVAGAENRPPMLEKSMYDSWASQAQQLQDDCDVQAMNIILHGLPPDVYALVNHQEIFSHLINDIHTVGMNMQQVQVNTKFLNALPTEWSKFVTDVKLAKSLYTTNYDQLYAYLSQHERHANEVCISHERYSDSIAFVANSPTLYNPSQSPQHLVNPQQHPISPPPFISLSMTQQSQAEFPQLDFSLTVPMFQQGEDLIECINKVMAFLSAVASRFPPSNNQLKTSSNPRNQATIQDGRVTVQKFKKDKLRVMLEKGHMARQCAQPKRPRNAAWFKEILMLAEAQEAGQILDEEQLAFLADPGISEALVAHCDPEVLSEVPYSDSYPNDMINWDVQEMQYSEQTHVDDFVDNEIHSGSNIIPYSQYLKVMKVVVNLQNLLRTTKTTRTCD